MEWSNWRPLTVAALDKHEIKDAGVYRIALRDMVMQYPKGKTSIIFIGSAPPPRLTERIKDHIKGWGNQCIYRHHKRGDMLCWQNMISGDSPCTENEALDDFSIQYGALPKCNENANTLNKTGGT